MKTYDDPQGGDAWLKRRLGVLSSSRAKSLVTAGGKVSKGKGVHTLAHELAAETIIGEPVREFSSAVMERGTKLEGEARAWLAYELGATIEEVGFFTTEDGRVGCSPDGVVRPNLGVELKVPMAHTQIKYAEDSAALHADYQHQVQVGMYVTEWPAWVLASYSPSLRIPNVLIRVERDDAYQEALKAAIPPVLAHVDALLAEMRERCPIDDNPFA